MPRKRKLPPIPKGKQPNRAERRAMARKVAKRLLGNRLTWQQAKAMVIPQLKEDW